MLDPLLRPLKDRLLVPVAALTGGAVSAGAATLASVVAGLAAALLAWRGEYVAGLGCFLLNRVLDGLDGTIARVRGTASDRGGYFDLLADFVVYAAVPLGLAAGSPHGNAFGPAAWLLASFYVNAMSWLYIAAVLERRGRGAAARGEQTSLAMPAALIGGTETILFYSAFFLLPLFLRALFVVMAALTFAGAVQRSIWAWRRL